MVDVAQRMRIHGLTRQAVSEVREGLAVASTQTRLRPAIL